MNHKQLLALYGLKWNPFLPDVPDDALSASTAVEHFIWRVESLVQSGGFALVTGEPGLGKSVVLRLLARKLVAIKDVTVCEFSRPQSTISDFYRELGMLFGLKLNYHSRYRTFQILRDQWKAYIESALIRPLLLIDEAQEMHPSLLSEIRLLSSMRFDSQVVLAVVFAGDSRLTDKFRSPELLPLGSRIRARLMLESYTPELLLVLLSESLKRAGAPQLFTKGLTNILAEHAAGNPRVMNTLANEILLLAAKQELPAPLDETLFFELTSQRKRA